MSRISNMKMIDILSQIDIILRDNDIIYFCKDMDIIKEFTDNFTIETNNQAELADFLVNHEKDFDKERLILLTVVNYKDNIKLLEEGISELEEILTNRRSREGLEEFAKINVKLNDQKEQLKKAIKLGKGSTAIIPMYYYDENKKKFRIDVKDAREVIDGKSINASKYIKRFDNIDSSFKNAEVDDNLGLEYMLQSILLTDIFEVFPTQQFGNDIRTMLLENEVLNKGIISKEQLQELKTLKYYEEYANLIDNVSFHGMLTQIKETLREYAPYIDMEKLLLISAYRFEEALENDIITNNECINAKNILEEILLNIKDKKAHFSGELQMKSDDSYELEEVTYEVKDIVECLARFTENTYVTKKEIKSYANMVNNKEITLSQIPYEYIDMIFSRSELENLSIQSPENLLTVYIKLGWDNSKILELYETGEIPLEYLKAIKERINLSDVVSFEKLNSYYKDMKENIEDEETLDGYQKYLNLYKEIFINEKNDEEIGANSTLLVEKMVEKFEGKDFNEAIKHYYIDGIITLDSIVEWSNSNTITELFEDGVLTLEDIRKIGTTLGYDYMHNLYTELVYRQDIEYDQRIEYIESGLVDKEDVINLYKNGLIMDEDLINIAHKAILPLDTAREIIDNRQLEDRIKTARVKALGWSDSNLLFNIDGIEKKHTDGVMYTNIFSEGTRKEKLIIDPNIRQKYIEMLGLYRIETECSYDNPFYNYEFYATPDETGAIGVNSVIIAERYYQNKYDEKTFATNNATYFFKYKDFLVLSNLQKKDMMKERENIVFRANHTITTNGKRGTWAENVLHNVLKTMLGSDLAHLSKKEKRTKIIEKMSQMYLKEECKDILDLCKEIDSGEYICNNQGRQYGKVPNKCCLDFDNSEDECR